MELKNKSYLLFIFNKSESDFKISEQILTQLTPVITSNFLKFNYIGTSLICNFKSNLPFDELKEFVSLSLDDIAAQYFLLEHPDKMSVFMPTNYKLNLFDLDSENRDVIDDQSPPDKLNFEEFMGFLSSFLTWRDDNLSDNDDYFDEEYDDPLINKIKHTNYGLTKSKMVDSILEKISDKGIKSLTKQELKILDEYTRE